MYSRAVAEMMGRKRWTKCLQWVVILVVLGEVAILLRLDRLHGLSFASSFASWNSSRFYESVGESKFPGDQVGDADDKTWTTSQGAIDGGQKVRSTGGEMKTSSDVDDRGGIVEEPKRKNCRAWLKEVDNLNYPRNFSKDPVRVGSGDHQVWNKCDVGCVFESASSKSDGVFKKISGFSNDLTVAHILRSMESATYYPENGVQAAHRNGFDVAMTTSLASDVPVGYFSWAEYDIMGPLSSKTEPSLAAAFISNCAAHNFRLEALEDLRKSGVTIDSYGNCLRTREGRGVNKLEALKRYKFSLAFENSNEDDYVTEKFWQSLVAGSVPVVVGAPNILQFAPAPNSLLHIESQSDVRRIANEMIYLGSNATAYNETLRWKYDGPSDSFKALVDMAAVHSSCRLCIHLATRIRSQEERELEDDVSRRPCKCTDESGVVTYHIFVRERGRFDLVSLFLRSSDLSIVGLQAAVLAKFKALRHVPIWWSERPSTIRGDGMLSIYRLYPVGLTQRDALYSVYFHTDDDVKGHLDDNPCPKLEVIFV